MQGLITVSASEDPADGVEKILCNVRGFCGFARQNILYLSKPVTRFDLDTRNSSPLGQFHVGAHVAYEKGSWEVDLKRFAGLLNKTCLGFSAIAVVGEFGH